MTQHSEEQNELAAGVEASVTEVEDAPVENEERGFFGQTSRKELLTFVGAVLIMPAGGALADFGGGRRFNPEKFLSRIALSFVIAVAFYFMPKNDEEELTPEPFTSKASELPRLLKKAVQVMHLSAEDEEANIGVWRALSYLSKKLDPAHKAVFTEDTIGDLKGFLASETRRDRLETIVRICAIAADPELLPLLRDLKDRTKDLDVRDNLRVVLREAISACAKSA